MVDEQRSRIIISSRVRQKFYDSLPYSYLMGYKTTSGFHKPDVDANQNKNSIIMLLIIISYSIL